MNTPAKNRTGVKVLDCVGEQIVVGSYVLHQEGGGERGQVREVDDDAVYVRWPSSIGEPDDQFYTFVDGNPPRTRVRALRVAHSRERS